MSRTTSAARAAQAWVEFGELDAYHGVLTEEQYRKANLDERSRSTFFDSGRRHVQEVRAHLDHAFGPAPLGRVLDFGCGTGRLVLGFAPEAEEVVGVDIAPAMLAELRKNATEAGCDNVEARPSEELSQLRSDFDLVHSVIVFQHIPEAEGRVALRECLRRVAPGGRVAIHIATGAANRFGSLYFGVVEHLPVFARVWNLIRRRPWGYPLMQMHGYHLNAVIEDFAEEGFPTVVVRWLPGRGRTAFDGVWLLAERPTTPRATA